MMGQVRIKLLTSIAMLAVASATLAEENQTEAGEALYVEFCAGCHGDNKSGLSQYSGDLTALTDRLEGLTEEMTDFAGFFEEDEIAAMQAYLSAPVSVGE